MTPLNVLQNVGWAVAFSIIGGAVGLVLVLAASVVLPRVIERFTPNIDEEKEIARGNVAVAEYFGRVGVTIECKDIDGMKYVMRDWHMRDIGQGTVAGGVLKVPADKPVFVIELAR